MKIGLTKYFGFRLKENQEISDLWRDFYELLEPYEAEDKTTFIHIPLNEKKGIEKSYLVEIKNEGVVLGLFDSKGKIENGHNELSGLVKLLGFNWNSKVFEDLNEKFYPLVEKYSGDF